MRTLRFWLRGRRYRVRVIYKSGYVQDVRCKAFTVKRNPPSGITVQWEHARPNPLLLGVDDVAAVYQL